MVLSPLLIKKTFTSKWGVQFLLCMVLVMIASAGLATDEYAVMRENMLKEIGAEARLTASYIKKSAFDERVMEAMGNVPRHQIVPEEQLDNSYKNRPLPIGHGQTISQPYIVALMTDLLEIKPGDRVLEIGTGSGYQAAVLSQLAKEVYTIEIIEPLHQRATQVFEQMGYANIHSRHGDGYYGWKEHAPYDAIIVTAAAGNIPPPLIEQLKPGGSLVVPVGGAFQTQQLVLVKKGDDGKLRTRQVLPVVFVPLTGDQGQR